MKITKLTAEKVHGYLPLDIEFFDELTFLTGLNGSGKTSALRLLMALLTPNIDELGSISFGSDLPGFSDQLILEKMAPRASEGVHEEEPIHRRADGGDPARGRRSPVAEVAKKHRSRCNDLFLAQALRGAGGADVKRLRALEPENRSSRAARRARSRDRRAEGDQPKKMVSPQARATQVAFANTRGIPIATGLRSALGLRARRCATTRAWRRRTRRSFPYAKPVCAVPALRLSTHPDLPGSPGSPDERRRVASALALRGAAIAEETAAPTHRNLPAAAAGTERHGQIWAYDFVFDACANGQQLKCLTVSTSSPARRWRSMWPAASVASE